MKIGIIGLGHVGATVAYTVLLRGLADELVLIDKNKKHLHAEAIDLWDASQNAPKKIKVLAGDYADLSDADIVVLAAGDISVLAHATDRLEELRVTSKIVADVALQLKESNFSGIVLAITNPNDVITMKLSELTGFDKSKIIGSGTLLDSNRLKNRIGSDAVMVLGEHGESQVAIGVTDKEATKKARLTGWEIAAEKGFTNYGVASATGRILAALINETGEELPVSVWDDKQQAYYSQLATFDKNGVKSQRLPKMTEEEKNALERSIETIKENFNSMNTL